MGENDAVTLGVRHAGQDEAGLDLGRWRQAGTVGLSIPHVSAENQ